jgi:hypothetical protein
MTAKPSINNQATLHCVNADFTSSACTSGDAANQTPNVINLSDNLQGDILQKAPISSFSLQVNNNYGDSLETDNSVLSNHEETNGTCQISIITPGDS